MDKLKLTYFDFPGGRGEAARLALHLAGVDWIDDRLSGDWPEVKPTTPFGGLPVLHVPGKGSLGQSNAILGYIGRAYGLFPTDPWEAARHDALLNSVEELRAEAAATGSDDEDEKRRKREAFAEGYLSRWAKHVSDQIEGPFVAGDELSVADLKLCVALRAYPKGVFDYIPKDVFEPFPKLTALIEAVTAHPAIAAWYARD